MTKSTLLGDIPIEIFLADYWQKKPLLIQGAVPQFDGLINPNDLAALSMRNDLDSRLILESECWQVKTGPFSEKTLTNLPESGWSLLVHDINFIVQEADELLHSFDFIPKARLDDLMVSLAPPGGNVGAHYDSFDVFLLQGLGRKRWQVSQQSDLKLVENAPLKLLSYFQPQYEWILEPGDMLYLPPHTAHHGVALDLSMTYSIGFRAPKYNELFRGFINHLEETRHLPGRYADPDLTLGKHPAALPANFIKTISEHFGTIQWGPNDIVDFLGCYLSEPKPNVVFRQPTRPLGQRAFSKKILKQGIRIVGAARLLFHKNQFWLNGALLVVEPMLYPQLKILADKRKMHSENLTDSIKELLYSWYLQGIIDIGI